MTFSTVYDIIIKVVNKRSGESENFNKRKGYKMCREKITLNNPERFSGKHVIAREKLEAAAKAATAKLKAKALEFMKDGEIGMDFPGNCSVDFKYVRNEN